MDSRAFGVCDAILFVVDAADLGRIETAKNELHNLLDKPQLHQIPVLVLGNKNDLPGCLSSDELVEKLDLVQLGQQREVSCYSISAKNLTNIDITITWLIEHVNPKGKHSGMSGSFAENENATSSFPLTGTSSRLAS